MSSYASSMRFLCDFYMGSKPALLKNRLFSRGISSPCATRKKFGASERTFAKGRQQNGSRPPSPLTTAPEHPGRHHACMVGLWAAHPAAAGERSHRRSARTGRGVGFILDRSWIAPGSLLGPFRPGKPPENRRRRDACESQKGSCREHLHLEVVVARISTY